MCSPELKLFYLDLDPKHRCKAITSVIVLGYLKLKCQLLSSVAFMSSQNFGFLNLKKLPFSTLKS